MSDLVEFLRARLNEDEALARLAAERVGDDHWQQRNVRIVTVADRDREVADYAIVECIDHIVRHGPARVQAEVEAKRRIITDVIPVLTGMEEMIAGEWNSSPDGAWPVLALLALPYASHPDYREEWRPDTP